MVDREAQRASEDAEDEREGARDKSFILEEA